MFGSENRKRDTHGLSKNECFFKIFNTILSEKINTMKSLIIFKKK